MKHQTTMKRGFTLIELLVVIAIMGILASIVYASLSTARSNARLSSGKALSANLERTLGNTQVLGWNFDECSGTTVTDSSGFANDATFIGTTPPTWNTTTPLNVGCSLTLNGTDNYVTSANSRTSLNAGTGSMTWSVWFKTTDTSLENLLRSGNGSGLGGVLLRKLNGGTVSCGVNAALTVTTTTKYTDGAWHHVACVLDRAESTLTLYIDGVMQVSTDATTLAATNITTTSAFLAGGATSFNGSIDNVRVYASALTASTVGAIYAAEKPLVLIGQR